MKKWMMVLLAVLMLAGCGKKGEEEAPKEFSLRDVSITLPEGIWRKNVSSTQNHFIRNDNVVGGIALLEMEKETMQALRHSFDYSDLILEYIKNNVIPGFDPSRYDGYMMGGSVYGYFEAEIITLDGETKHFLLEGENDYFDVWFDRNFLDEKTMAKIVESIRSEALTVTGHAEFAEDN